MPTPTFPRRKVTEKSEGAKTEPKKKGPKSAISGLDPWEQSELDKLTEKMQSGMTFHANPIWTPLPIPKSVPQRSQSVPIRSSVGRLPLPPGYGATPIPPVVNKTPRNPRPKMDPEPNPDDSGDDSSSSSNSSRGSGTENSGSNVRRRLYTINGEEFEIADVPQDALPEDGIMKLWDKHERARLKPDRFQLWYRQLTRPIFPGKTRLEQPDFRANVDGTLRGLDFLESKLRLLQYHFHKMDTIEIFTIVRPVDVMRTHECYQPPYDLFVDHYKLTAAQVALSCLYWRTWIGPSAPYILQNLQFTVDALEQNSSDSLWSRALQDMAEFPLQQQGGPLILFLELKRIRNTSEAAMDTLKAQFRAIKIKKIKGKIY
jgi:hypothetical protein